MLRSEPCRTPSRVEPPTTAELTVTCAARTAGMDGSSRSERVFTPSVRRSWIRALIASMVSPLLSSDARK